MILWRFGLYTKHLQSMNPWSTCLCHYKAVTFKNLYLDCVSKILTRLLRQITGHKEQPNVQQQQRQPQNSHLTFTGRVFFNIPFIRITVSLNSSGATRDTKPLGNSVLNLLLKPNLKQYTHYCT